MIISRPVHTGAFARTTYLDTLLMLCGMPPFKDNEQQDAIKQGGFGMADTGALCKVLMLRGKISVSGAGQGHVEQCSTRKSQ